MPSSIYCTTAALRIAITTLTTFTLHAHWYQTLLWFNIVQNFKLINIQQIFLAIFNKYLRVLKIWLNFSIFFFFFQNFHEIWSWKTCHLLHFMALTCAEVSVSIQCFDWSKMAAEGFPVAPIDEYAKPCEPAIHVLRSVTIAPYPTKRGRI